jgi:hypothetical protein
MAPLTEYGVPTPGQQRGPVPISTAALGFAGRAG